jgi:CRP-like cAMP-binding protein
MSPDSFARLSGELTTVRTPVRYVFHEAGKPIESVYFPNGGVASVTTVVSDGRMVECATIGTEGIVGVEAVMSSQATAQGRTMMQVADSSVTAEVLPVRALRGVIARDPAFAELLGRYALALLRQTMHATACNALHHVQERCARWLLMTHDRVEGDSFHLSHEFLGMMLGVRRQSVTVVAGTLQRAGLITYRQAVVQIKDRQALEAASCECYRLIRKEFDAFSL